MSAATTWIAVGLAGIALAATTIVLGVLWMHRRLAHVAAERRTALLASFKSPMLPEPGEVVQALLDAKRQAPLIIDAHHEPARGWIDARTSQPVARAVLGWRPDPFDREWHRSHNHLSTDELAREMAALVDEGASSEASRVGYAFDLPPQAARTDLRKR